MDSTTLKIITSLKPSGMSHQLLFFARGLREQGETVRVVAFEDGTVRQLLEADGVPVDILRRRHRFDPLVAVRLIRLLFKHEPTTTQSYDDTSDSFLTAAIVKGFSDAWLRYLGDLPTRATTRRSVSKWICQSQAIYNAMQTAGVAEDRLKYLPRRVDPVVSTYTREQAFAELNLPADARPIAVVSQLLPRKNVKELIWAADLVRVLDDRIRLVIFGEGPQRAALERFAHLASDLKHVRFAGWRDDLRQLLPHFDQFWHAGDETAPPLAVMEAQAAGVPIIADATPGCVEALAETDATLIPPGDRAARGQAAARLLERNTPALVSMSR